MTVYGMRVAINFDEQDNSVEDDNVDWDCKLGALRTTEGGGSFLKEASHATCTFDVAIPLNLAPLVRYVTIAIQGDYLGTAPAWYHNTTGDTYYRIIFHGTITAYRARQPGDKYVQFEAISEMQELFERHAHLAAATNTGIRPTCTAIESAHSMTIANDTMLPLAADFFTLDRPKQKSASNGDWIRTACAGTGLSVIAEWEGTIGSPNLAWRTDRRWFTGGNFRSIKAYRPWEYAYLDVGISFRDFVGRVEVNGWSGQTLSHAGYVRYPTIRHQGDRPPTRIIDVRDGTRYWGEALLPDPAARAEVGYMDASVNSWIDTAAQCEDSALFLLSRMGSPTWPGMKRVGWYPDHIYASAAADAGFIHDAEDYGMDHATVAVGDVMESRVQAELDLVEDEYGDWPASCGPGTQVYTDLFDGDQPLWKVRLTGDATSGGTQTDVTSDYTVRTLNRTWDPRNGWYIEVGLEPLNHLDDSVFDTFTDHGTY